MVDVRERRGWLHVGRAGRGHAGPGGRAHHGTGDWTELLLAAYAIESTQGPVAETKLDGLRRFYGVRDAWATAYFEVHESRDEAHAAEICELVSWHVGSGDEQRLLVSARRAWAGNWALLDGVARAPR